MLALLALPLSAFTLVSAVPKVSQHLEYKTLTPIKVLDEGQVDCTDSDECCTKTIWPKWSAGFQAAHSPVPAVSFMQDYMTQTNTPDSMSLYCRDTRDPFDMNWPEVPLRGPFLAQCPKGHIVTAWQATATYSDPVSNPDYYRGVCAPITRISKLEVPAGGKACQMVSVTDGKDNIITVSITRIGGIYTRQNYVYIVEASKDAKPGQFMYDALFRGIYSTRGYSGKTYQVCVFNYPVFGAWASTPETMDLRVNVVNSPLTLSM